MSKFLLWCICLLFGCWQEFWPKIKMASQASTLNFNTSSFFIVNDPITQFGGTLNTNSAQSSNISGQTIGFSNGVVNVDGSQLVMAGTFDPTNSDKLLLNNGDKIYTTNGTIATQFQVQSGATATVVGCGIFAQPLQLTGATSTLQLGLQSGLNQNIELNGGTVTLLDDLTFNLGKSFVGTGTINCNNRSLNLPGGTVADANLTFQGVNQLNLTGNLTLNTEISFTGASGTSAVEGNSFTCTFGSSGGLKATANHTLVLNGLHLKNFGALVTRGYFDLAATATVVLQGCTINLAGNYAHTAGTILFRDGCKIIHNGFNFATSGLAFVVVDGVAVEYENLSLVESNPFTFTDAASQRQLLNNGVIRVAASSSTNSGPGGTTLTVANSSNTVAFDFTLTSTNKVLVTNATPASPKAVTIDWSGQNVYFPMQGNGLFSLEANVNLTTSNVLLFGYNPAVISYGDANASLAFGSNSKMLLFQDVALGGGDKAWNFTGNGEIIGCNNHLTLTSSNRLTVNSGSTLTLKNLRLVIQHATALSCLDSNSKIVLQNCQVAIHQNGFDFAQGNLDIAGAVKFVGGSTAVVDTQAKFSFASSGQMRVLSQGCLSLDRGIEFEYKADPSGDANNISTSKRHFKLLDPSACLELKGATLHSTMTGFRLDHGRVVLDDEVNWIVAGTGIQALELGSAVELILRPGAVLVLDGQLLHIATTFI